MGTINTTIEVQGVDVTTTVRNEYNTLNLLWKLNQEAYEGSEGFIDGSRLQKFTRESTENYNRRKAVCRYTNYPKALADTLSGHLFKRPIQRKLSNDTLHRFSEATNKIGNKTMNELIKEVYLYSYIKGFCYVLVDKPNIVTETRLEEESAAMPYAYVIQPEFVLDWQTDDNGELIWVKVLEIYIPEEEKANPRGDHTDQVRFRYWTRTGWFVTNVDGGKLAGMEGEHGLGAVPIVVVRNDTSLTYPDLGETEFKGMAQIALSIFNKDSETDHLLVSQTFALLTINSTTPATEVANTNDTTSEKNAASLGTDSVIYYPEGSNKPEFISPDTGSVDSYEKIRNQLVEDIKEIAKQKGTSGVNSSGKARQHDFEKTNQAIVSKAETLHDAEVNIFELVAKWMKQEPGDIDIDYPQDFNLVDLNEEIDRAINTLEIGISETFDKEFKKKLSKKIMPTLPDKTQKTIDDEIDVGMDVMDIESTLNEPEIDENDETEEDNNNG